jgi:hypothetical protein
MIGAAPHLDFLVAFFFEIAFGVFSSLFQAAGSRAASFRSVQSFAATIRKLLIFQHGARGHAPQASGWNDHPPGKTLITP